MSKKLERAKGFEPSTPTLARLCSTPELRPLDAAPLVKSGWGAGLIAPPFGVCNPECERVGRQVWNPT